MVLPNIGRYSPRWEYLFSVFSSSCSCLLSFIPPLVASRRSGQGQDAREISENSLYSISFPFGSITLPWTKEVLPFMERQFALRTTELSVAKYLLSPHTSWIMFLPRPKLYIYKKTVLHFTTLNRASRSYWVCDETNLSDDNNS